MRTNLTRFFAFQGRYGKGKGQEFLQQFLIEYRHLEMGRANTWMVYSDKNGKQVKESIKVVPLYQHLLFFQIFDANKDTVTPVFTTFDPPLFADQIRIIPFSVHPRIICLRFELHGCKDESKKQKRTDEKTFAKFIFLFR